MQQSDIDHVSPPVGPNIVKAWFESALNPLLRGLENEAAVLRKNTFTWRERTGEMAAILPIYSHLRADKWGNLDQFLLFYGEIKRLCDQHDVLVTELAHACQRMFDTLLSNQEFTRLVTEVYESDRLALPPGQTTRMFQEAHKVSVIIRWIAEYIVNSSGPLGDHHWTAPLWNPFREEFLMLAKHGALQNAWLDVERVARELLSIVEQLLSLLRQVRHELSIKFDVPPEPLES
jgi:hypothetical protein